MRLLQTGVLMSCLLTGAGCASLSGAQDRHFACSYATVWDMAMETMKDRPITVQDKAKGVIQTDWVEVEGAARPYGMFGREGFGNRERVRTTLLVKQLNGGTSVSLSENRQVWHLKGGVTSQATKWWPVDPSEEAMAVVLNRLNAKLKERGCSPS